MKLIKIYGPPAVGKLSVAEELSKITNFKVFHNHMANDIIANYLEFDEGDFWRYTDRIKKEVYKMAVREDINLITTTCFAQEHDEKGLKKQLKFFKKHSVKIYFVRLKCDREKLFKRVKKHSRKKHGKLKDAKKLKETLKKYRLEEPIDFVKSLEIDNTKISPKKVAQKIKKELKLK